MVLPTEIKPLSERERKIITSLRLVKKRNEEGLFVAEGLKAIELLRKHYKVMWLVASDSLLLDAGDARSRLTTEQEMKKLSSLESRQELIAVFEIPKEPIFKPSELTVALDEIQNPGNLGTLIRLCDWLGIRTIICGKGCADLYNPKVVQASMGALGNVQVIQDIDLETFLPQHFHHIYTTAMEGTDYRKVSVPDCSVIIFGNEGKGVSPSLLSLSTGFITIPSADTTISESLNVSLSAAILLSALTR